MDSLKGFNLDRTWHSHKVKPLKKPTESPITSMPSYFALMFKNSRRRELFVSSDDGESHSLEKHHGLIAISFIDDIDSSLFTCKEEDQVKVRVHEALSEACVSKIQWEEISEEVMVKGIAMANDNLEVYKKGCPARFYEAILVDVVIDERFVCYEGVGEC